MNCPTWRNPLGKTVLTSADDTPKPDIAPDRSALTADRRSTNAVISAARSAATRRAPRLQCRRMFLAGDRNGRDTVGNSTASSVGPGPDLDEERVAPSDTRTNSSNILPGGSSCRSKSQRGERCPAFSFEANLTPRATGARCFVLTFADGQTYRHPILEHHAGHSHQPSTDLVVIHISDFGPEAADHLLSLAQGRPQVSVA